MTSATDTPSSSSELLLPLHRQSGFLSFLLSRLAAVFAMQIQAIVVAWQVYDITRDPMALAYVGLAQFLPMVLLLLPAGDFVDRFSRKRILQLSWVVQGLCSSLLLTLSLNGSQNVSGFYAVLALFGAARAFTGLGLGDRGQTSSLSPLASWEQEFPISPR